MGHRDTETAIVNPAIFSTPGTVGSFGPFPFSGARDGYNVADA